MTHLPSELRAALRERGYHTLTSIQQAVLDGAARGRNLRLSSQTGSGKTLALGFALAPELMATLAARSAGQKGRGPLALVITPTRELAAQVRNELSWLYAGVAGASVAVVTGGTSIGPERRALSRRPTLLVGTPGRLLDHLRCGALDLGDLRHVVLDEADRMLDMGFREELEVIVEALPEQRRSHLVSATFPGALRSLADRFQSDALHLEGTALGQAHEDIEHVVHVIHSSDRYAALVNALLLLRGERCLVFVQRRDAAAELAEQLASDGFVALPFSGELPQAQRTRTLRAFRDGIVNTLVATDVAARGIDVADIAMVVQMDMPFEPDVYVHRSGRTGRAGKKGRSLLLVPSSAERRMRRMLQDAKVDACWAPPLTPQRTRKTILKAFRAELHARLERADVPSDADQSYAEGLLARYDPAALVTHLLEMAEPKLPREPMAISEVGRRRDPRRVGPKHFVHFHLNWGHRQGATPGRLLAHVCRRGDLSSRDVGTMTIEAEASVIEILEGAARQLELRTRKPDARDPSLRITRLKGSPADERPCRGPKRGRPKPGLRKSADGRRAPRKGKGKGARRFGGSPGGGRKKS